MGFTLNDCATTGSFDMENSDRAARLLEKSFVWDQGILWSDVTREEDILKKLAGWGVNGVCLKINPAFNMAASWFAANLTAVVTNRMSIREGRDAHLLSSAGKGDGMSVTFSLADTAVLDNPVRDIELFSALGVTSILLASMHNLSGASCYDEDGGLTRYGRQLVAWFNESSILLDGTLSGYRTSMEAMALSEKPFIFSHVNPWGVCNNRRNIRDDQIKACAATGGVVGITFIGGYLGSENPDAECLFRNLDYLCQLIGPGHVGIGSNYMTDTTRFWEVLGPLAQPGELKGGGCFDYAGLPRVIELMLNHGYADQDISDILGGNWFRLFSRNV